MSARPVAVPDADPMSVEATDVIDEVLNENMQLTKQLAIARVQIRNLLEAQGSSASSTAAS